MDYFLAASLTGMSGDHRIRTLSCDPSNAGPMAFAQLTDRVIMRDIETCFSVHASQLYHIGFRQPVRRSTLADANESAQNGVSITPLAQRLITQARTLYVDEELPFDLTNTGLRPGLDDHRSVPVGLSVRPLPHRSRSAVEDAHAV